MENQHGKRTTTETDRTSLADGPKPIKTDENWSNGPRNKKDPGYAHL